MEINRELVERITREVVGRLQGADTPSTAAAPTQARLSGGVLAVLTGSPVGVEEVANQLATLASQRGGLTVYLTRCAEGRAGEEIARRLNAPILRESENASVARLLDAATLVVYPNCSMTTAAKISLLMSDGPSAGIGIEALVRRIPVAVATNSLLASVSSGGYTPPEFQSVGSEHIARLARVGVRTCDIRELSSVAGASAPAGATLTVASSFSTPPAAVECAPLARTIEEYVVSAMADDPSCQPCAAKLRAVIDQCVEAGACRIGTFGESDADAHGSGVNRMIDHTLLKPTTTPDEIEKLCAEAREYKFKSVCINPGYVSLCKRLLKGSGVLVCTVVGFPLGATTTASKAAETRDAVADGADEIDMVINIGALKSGDYEKVKHDIEAVVEAAKGRTTKVIFETHLLTDEEKVAACQLSVAAGAHFVKTATGFSGGGATAEDIALMRRVVGPALGVKASGGVRTREDADKMIKAGANRIGASASIEIVTGKKSNSKGY